MTRFRIKTTKSGKCDVTVVLFDKNRKWLLQNSTTFDIKPTVKELLNKYKPCKKDGAKYIEISTQPSGNKKIFNL